MALCIDCATIPMTTKPDTFSEAKELSRLDDPAVRSRCVKLKWRSDLQNRLAGAGGLFLLATFLLLERGYVGSTSRYSHRYSPPLPVLIPYGYATLGVALTLFLGLIGFRNYCLLDPVEQRLYESFQFLWWRKRRVVFRSGEILAITTDGRPRRGKYGVHWYYRMVAVGRDGRKEPLSNWRQGGLDKWNARARQLAPQFGCEHREAPERCEVSVENEGGAPVLRFLDPGTGAASSGWRIGLAIGIAVLWFLFVLFWRARR